MWWVGGGRGGGACFVARARESLIHAEKRWAGYGTWVGHRDNVWVELKVAEGDGLRKVIETVVTRTTATAGVTHGGPGGGLKRTLTWRVFRGSRLTGSWRGCRCANGSSGTAVTAVTAVVTRGSGRHGEPRSARCLVELGPGPVPGV